MQKVFFHYADKKLAIRQNKQLKVVLMMLFKMEGIALSRIDYIFCSDDYLLNINKKFLNHDDYTDIITFDLSEKKNPKVGEIYISVDRIIQNSRQLNTNKDEEFKRVIFHGALHLCGLKDKKKLDIKKMREKEDYYISLLTSVKLSVI